MTDNVSVSRQICGSFGNDKGRLMDILLGVQAQAGCIAPEALDEIAKSLSLSRVEVESAATFYAFFSPKPRGKFVIRLCNDVPDQLRVSTASRPLTRRAGHRVRADHARRPVLARIHALHRHVRPGAGGAGQRRRSSPGVDRHGARDRRDPADDQGRRAAQADRWATATTPSARALDGEQQPARARRGGLRAVHPRGGPAARAHRATRRGDSRRQDLALARPRRRRLPHRHEVGVHARRRRRAQVHRVQRRRGRAGHLQGSRDPDRARRT